MIPWISLASASLTLCVLLRLSLQLFIAFTLLSLILLAIREAYGKPLALGICSGLALDIGGFLSPLMIIIPFLAYIKAPYVLLATALYSMTAATLAKPSPQSLSLNVIAYSVPPTITSFILLGANSLSVIPIASFLGVLIYGDLAYYLATYRSLNKTFIVGGAGGLDALVVCPAISTSIAIGLLSLATLLNT